MKGFYRNTVFLAVVACWLWSTAFAGVKIGLKYQPPLQFAAVRFFISGMLLLAWYGKPAQFAAEIKKNLKFVLIVAFLQIFVQYAFFYTGLSLIPAALGAMIVGSSPLFIAVVAHFMVPNDKFTPMKLASILAGVAGIAVITMGRSAIVLKNHLEWVGIGLLILNNIMTGYANVLISRDKSGISPVALSSASLITGSLLLFGMSLPIEGIHFSNLPPAYFYALAWLGFLSAAAYTIWYSLLKRPGVKVSNLNTWKFLIPVSGAVLSWLIVPGESPDLFSVVGMGIIAVALILLALANQKSGNPADKPENRN